MPEDYTTSFNGQIISLPDIKNVGYTKQGFIQQCAMTLFCNINFNETDKPTNLIADECFSRANKLADLIEKKIGF